MRNLVAVVLLCCAAQCAERFIDMVHLGSARSEADKESKGKSVKLVVVVGSKASYVLKCNEGEKTCKTPDVGTDYTLVSNSDLDVYECENVALAIPRTVSYRGVYCLVETQPNN